MDKFISLLYAGVAFGAVLALVLVLVIVILVILGPETTLSIVARLRSLIPQ